jgi:hypothetical protein
MPTSNGEIAGKMGRLFKGSAMLYRCRDQKESHLAVAFFPFPSGRMSFLDTLPASLFFALATGFNLGILDNVQALQFIKRIH